MITYKTQNSIYFQRIDRIYIKDSQDQFKTEHVILSEK